MEPRTIETSIATRALNRITRGGLVEPCVIVTDKLRRYFKPVLELAPGMSHRAHKDLNSRFGESHRPTRKREKLMGRFKSPRQAQRFLAAQDQINTIFRPRRLRLSSASSRRTRADALNLGNDHSAELTA